MPYMYVSSRGYIYVHRLLRTTYIHAGCACVLPTVSGSVAAHCELGAYVRHRREQEWAVWLFIMRTQEEGNSGDCCWRTTFEGHFLLPLTPLPVLVANRSPPLVKHQIAALDTSRATGKCAPPRWPLRVSSVSTVRCGHEWRPWAVCSLLSSL